MAEEKRKKTNCRISQSNSVKHRGVEHDAQGHRLFALTEVVVFTSACHQSLGEHLPMFVLNEIETNDV